MIALSRKPGKLDTGLIGRGLEGFQTRAGVELPRVLWIRCGETADRERDLKTASYFAGMGKEIKKTGSRDAETKKPMQIHGWRHPRELMRGVDQAISSLIGKQTALAESAQ